MAQKGFLPLMAMAMITMGSGCPPKTLPPSPPPGTPPAQVKPSLFNTWQEAAIFGSERLVALLDSGRGSGTGVNSDSLRNATPRFPMLRLRIGFPQLLTANESLGFDPLVVDTFSLAGVMANQVSSPAVIEVIKRGMKWSVATMGDQRLTHRVNDVFTLTQIDAVDSLVLYEVVNLRAAIVKVFVGGTSYVASAYMSNTGHLIQHTESDLLKKLKADALQFKGVNDSLMTSNSTISG